MQQAQHQRFKGGRSPTTALEDSLHRRKRVKTAQVAKETARPDGGPGRVCGGGLLSQALRELARGGAGSAET